MAEKKTAAKKAGTSDAATSDTGTWTDAERAAMKARGKELKARRSSGGSKVDGASEVLAAIAAMPEPDRGLAERLHAIVTANAPGLAPKTWYGMPAYARDGKVVCYFKGAYKFKSRYAQFGFEDAATLDDGGMWPVVFGLTTLTAAEEKRIVALLKQAVG